MIDVKLYDSKISMEFRKICPGNNFITPYIIDYKKIGRYIIEISMDPYHYVSLCIYGVTVVDTERKERCIDLDKSFVGDTEKETKKKAYDYIDELIKKYRNDK